MFLFLSPICCVAMYDGLPRVGIMTNQLHFNGEQNNSAKPGLELDKSELKKELRQNCHIFGLKVG